MSDRKDNPLVSVVIPLYNGEKFIRECLESVYQQTYRPIEVIVVDDGSTDRSPEMVREFPGEKKLIRIPNSDVSHARNVGVENARGELIAFLDQDDKWLPEKIEKQVKLFRENPDVDLIFTDLIKFYPSGKRHHAPDKHRLALSLTDENLFSQLVIKNVLMPSAVMVKKESFLAAGAFDPEFRTCGDYEMWLRMAARGMKFCYLPEPLTLYRQHGENTSRQAEVMYRDRIKAIEKTFTDEQLTEQQKKLKSAALAAAYMEGAHAFFGVKEYRKFLENARRAFSLDKRVVNWKFIRRWVRSYVYLGFKQSPAKFTK